MYIYVYFLDLSYVIYILFNIFKIIKIIFLMKILLLNGNIENYKCMFFV